MGTNLEADLLVRTLKMMDAALARPLTRDELIAAQKRLCEERGYPHFAPHDGYCWGCKKDMVTQSWTAHITGCQHCHRSYCD